MSSPRSGREGRDHVADRGQVELADGAASDHVDLVLAGPVDVGDLAELGARRVADGRADDLVPVRGARGSRSAARSTSISRYASRSRSAAWRFGHLLEPQAPARSVLDGLCGE